MSKSTKKATNTAAAVTEAIATARAELDRVDAEVARLREQRSAVAGAPLPRDEALQAMRTKIDAQAAEGNRRLDQIAELIGRPGGAERWEPADDLQRWAPGTGTWTLNKPLALALLGDSLKTALEKRIANDPRHDGEDVLPADKREGRLAELDAAIEQAEARRDQLERELADAGFFPEAESPTPEGGDRGMAALREQHERQRQATNRELERVGVSQRARPRVIHAFERDETIRVREDQ